MSHCREIPGMLILLLLAACSNQQNYSIKAPLDTIRAEVKQSALLTAQAACSESGEQQEMIHAAVTMLRHAMGGPEMMKIHKIMGRIPDEGNGQSGTPLNNDSPDMKVHAAIHDVGEGLFNLLDMLSQSPGVDCEEVRPIRLAATAALMREYQGSKMNEVSGRLDAESDHLLNEQSPLLVKALVLALHRM